MRILGLVANTHDSGIALVRDGSIECVIEEERLNREKRTKAFPELALAAARQMYDLDLSDIDAVVTPWNERNLRRFTLGAVLRRLPASLNLLHARAHPGQRNQILALTHNLRRDLARTFAGARVPPIQQVGHHDAHAAMFFVSPFDEALVLVMDGYGDDASMSAYVGQGNRLERVWSTPIFNSLGLLYTFVTGFLGFEPLGDEGKVMALAAFGKPSLVDAVQRLVRLEADGDYALDMSYFAFDRYGQIAPFSQKFLQTFGQPTPPGSGGVASERDRDLAYALQHVTETTILHIVRGLLKRFPMRNIVLTGGVALNCVANARVATEVGVDRVWVPPCASDTGAPLGAALWHTHQTNAASRRFELTHPYWGTSASNADIEAALRVSGLAFERLAEPDIVARAAAELANGRILGWFQGRFEIGPRALGNRSILADPRAVAMRDKLNSRVKRREPFRPFSPSIPLERAAEFFELAQPDPFMTLAPRVREDKRDLIPAALHVDGTGRIQTVDRAANPRYHALLTAFGALTGVPVLLNTSFNEQEPIVATPRHAIDCFLRTNIDVLVLGDYVVEKPNRCERDTVTAARAATTETIAT